MLCKIHYFRKEKRFQSTSKTSSMSTLHNSDAEPFVLIIIYGCLRVLQMGLFRNYRTKIKRRNSLNSKSQLVDIGIQTLFSEIIFKL